MVSYKINIGEDERFIKVNGSTRFFYIILGLFFLTLQVAMWLPVFLDGYGREDILMLVFIESLFSIMLYAIASWQPFYFFFLKDKKKRVLIFFAAPGCWRKKVYPLISVSGLLVEDRGDWLGRLYVLGEKKHRVFDGNIYMVRELASKAAEAFNITVQYE